MSSKGAIGRPWGHNLKLTLDILEFRWKAKKKVLGVFYDSLWVLFLNGAMAFFISLKGVICKNVQGIQVYINITLTTIRFGINQTD